MCLKTVTDRPKIREWTLAPSLVEAYKVCFIDEERSCKVNRLILTPEWRDDKIKHYSTGEALHDSDKAFLEANDGNYYATGFHAFVNRKDAIRHASGRMAIVKVNLGSVVAYGTGGNGEPQVVGRAMSVISVEFVKGLFKYSDKQGRWVFTRHHADVFLRKLHAENKAQLRRIAAHQKLIRDQRKAMKI
jgi:hypothetical protein